MVIEVDDGPARASPVLGFSSSPPSVKGKPTLVCRGQSFQRRHQRGGGGLQGRTFRGDAVSAGADGEAEARRVVTDLVCAAHLASFPSDAETAGCENCQSQVGRHRPSGSRSHSRQHHSPVRDSEHSARSVPESSTQLSLATNPSQDTGLMPLRHEIRPTFLLGTHLSRARTRRWPVATGRPRSTPRDAISSRAQRRPAPARRARARCRSSRPCRPL
jgi:hypothetical protein